MKCNVNIPTGNVAKKREEVIADLKRRVMCHAREGKICM